MGPDPTRAYFWPAVNKRPTRHGPGHFLARPDGIFLIRKEKNKKFGIFRRNFPMLNPNQRWLIWPDPTQATKNWSDQGQKYLVRTHHCTKSCRFWDRLLNLQTNIRMNIKLVAQNMINMTSHYLVTKATSYFMCHSFPRSCHRIPPCSGLHPCPHSSSCPQPCPPLSSSLHDGHTF